MELTGARWVGHTDVQGRLPERQVVPLHARRADEVIGLPTDPAEQRAILARLGFEPEHDNVRVPTWRARDVTREIDAVEEVARFRLDDVPFTLPRRREMFGWLTPEQRLRRRLEDVLAGLGFSETYTPSLRAEDPDPRALRLLEPISAELAVLRTTLLPSLLEAARRNLAAGAQGIALFEIGRSYLPESGLPDEHARVAAVLQGGFLRAKGIVEALYAAIKAETTYEPATHELFHPGKTARLPEGWLGELHPALLEGEWSAFELDLAALLSAAREPSCTRT